MAQKVNNRFPATLAHTTPINNQYIMVLKMIHHLNFIQRHRPCKDQNLPRHLNTPDASPRKKLIPIEPSRHYRKTKHRTYLLLKVPKRCDPPLV